MLIKLITKTSDVLNILVDIKLTAKLVDQVTKLEYIVRNSITESDVVIIKEQQTAFYYNNKSRCLSAGSFAASK